jgi:hypothetical protein
MQHKWLVVGLLVILVVTGVGGVFAQEPTRADIPFVEGPDGPEATWDCSWWWEDPWLSDTNWNGVLEERTPPIPFGGFTSPSGWKITNDHKLGDQVSMFFPVFDPDGDPAVFWPVDVYLWRPPTYLFCQDLDLAPAAREWVLFYGWPFQGNAKMDKNFVGSGLLTGAGSEWDFDSWYQLTWDNPDGPRRQSWPKYQSTDSVGFYYAKFMLPRDEVWYPCSYPGKWDCNFYDPWTDTWEFHSPWLRADKYPASAPPFASELFPLYWPYKWDSLYGWTGDLPWTAGYDEAIPYPQWAEIPIGSGFWYYLVLPSLTDPQDTVAPLTLWAVEGMYDTYIDLVGGVTPWDEIEVLGYDWKTSDLQWAQWPDDWPYLVGDHRWY